MVADDVRRFQKILKENYKAQRMNEASKMNDDGSAVDPAAYLEMLKMSPKGKEWLRTVKEHGPELYPKIVEGDTEALRTYLRWLKQRAEQEEAPPPPNPPTPYDKNKNVKIGMSMRILTDEGEEKDLYQVMPEETEEEKWHMPKEMECTACQAVAYNAATTVHARLASRYKDELVGTVTLEALQELCANEGMWTQTYGVMPTAGGYNVFNGTGIELPSKTEFENQDVMLTAQHSSTSGKKLVDVCKSLILGADAPEEEEFASMSLEAGEDVEAAIKKYRKELCFGHNKGCDGIELAKP